MEDLGKRAALTYCGLSVSIFFIDHMMIGNGDDSASNPAWQLVSALYQLIKWSWWLSLGAAVIVSLIGLKIFIANQIQIRRIEKKERERQKNCEQNATERFDQEILNQAIHERKLGETKAEEERQKCEALLREKIRQEKLKRRTADEAIAEALEDFF